MNQIDVRDGLKDPPDASGNVRDRLESPQDGLENPSYSDQVADVLERWNKGEEPDAEAVLRAHPELAADKETAADLAIGEFCLRLERGEFVNPRAFADHFPTCRSTLFRIMHGQQLLVDNPGLVTDPPRKQWPAPGVEFVGFRVVRELGRGAFARVYLATEPALGNRTVVLKVGMHGGGEADILGRLRHDNIVPIYAMRQDLLTGMTVVCMPYLGATTLADVIEHAFARPGVPDKAAILLQAARPKAEEEESLGPIKPNPILLSGTYVEGVLDMGIQLAEALAFVHKRKIYHRDLKPSNVLVRPDGRPMLLDFNLSFDEQAAQQTLGGTLIYMAPEMLQAVINRNAGPFLIDARSDLYSLGVILYEMLSGEHPFEEIFWGKSAEGNRERLAELQKTGLRPLRQANPQVDKKIAGVVDRCLAYDPAKRFQSAGELAAALRRCLSWPQRWRRRLARHRRAVVAAGVMAIMFVAVAAALLARRDPYSQRQFKEGMRAFKQGQYAEAVDHLSFSLGDAESPQGHLARGRAYMQLDKPSVALEDFRAADKLQPTGKTQAALGYCYNVLGKHDWAAGCYRHAITRDFQTAIVFNNLGYSLMSITKPSYTEAADYFRKAASADPRLQVAYFNHATLASREAASRERFVVPLGPSSLQAAREGLQAIRKALEIGPPAPQMHHDAARLYVMASQIEPRWKELAFEHLEAAIGGGLPPARLKGDHLLRQLQGARFKALTDKPAPKSAPPSPIRVLDPLAEN